MNIIETTDFRGRPVSLYEYKAASGSICVTSSLFLAKAREGIPYGKPLYNLPLDENGKVMRVQV